MARYDSASESKGMGVKVRRIIAYVVLIFFAVLCLFWFYVLLINATRDHGDFTKGFRALPSTFFLENWVGVLGDARYPAIGAMFNSLWVASASAILCTYFSSMTAYAIHAYDFKGKKFIFTFILMVMTIPTQVTAIGFVQMINGMNLDDTYVPLIIPSIAAPVTFFYMKQYMESTLHPSLIEAARMDGSGEFRTFNTIVLPLMKPAIAVQAIFTFVSSWNNYFTPALVLHEKSKFTLPIVIAALRNSDFNTLDHGEVYMIIAISIFPVVIVYLFLSKYIVQGITAGGVKG